MDIVSRILDGKESFDENFVKLAYANVKVKSAEVVSNRSSKFPGKKIFHAGSTRAQEPHKSYIRPTCTPARGSFRGRGSSRGRGVPTFVPFRGGRSKSGARASRGQGSSRNSFSKNHTNENQNILLSSIF
jgi:hypothetical protein